MEMKERRDLIFVRNNMRKLFIVRILRFRSSGNCLRERGRRGGKWGAGWRRPRSGRGS